MEGRTYIHTEGHGGVSLRRAARPDGAKHRSPPPWFYRSKVWKSFVSDYPRVEDGGFQTVEHDETSPSVEGGQIVATLVVHRLSEGSEPLNKFQRSFEPYHYPRCGYFGRKHTRLKSGVRLYIYICLFVTWSGAVYRFPPINIQLLLFPYRIMEVTAIRKILKPRRHVVLNFKYFFHTSCRLNFNTISKVLSTTRNDRQVVRLEAPCCMRYNIHLMLRQSSTREPL